MAPAVVLKAPVLVLCLLTWAGLAVGDRLYIHPFHLLFLSKTRCDELEKSNMEGSPEPTFAPAPIQAKTSPVDEEALSRQLLQAARQLEAGDRQRATEVRILANFMGFHMYRMLNEVQGTASGAVFSPTALFGTLASLYLGSLDPTAGQLQAFLGLPGKDQCCTSRLDGHKVLSALQAIQGLLVAQGGAGNQTRLQLSTVVGLFTARGLRLKTSFVEGLAPFAPVVLPRSLDLSTNPGLATEDIHRFLQGVTGWRMSEPQSRVGADGTLIFNTYVRFQAKLRGFSLLPGSREFRVGNGTSVSVPMLSGTGVFPHWSDRRNNLTMMLVPLGGSASLLLLWPHCAADLGRVEALIFHHEFLTWMKKLSPRAIRLTLPQLELRGSHDLQDLLAQAKVPFLLGPAATLGGISDPSPRMGEILNSILFELKADDRTQQPKSAQQPGSPKALEVTLNSPFLFAIHERGSGALHFLGRVVSP